MSAALTPSCGRTAAVLARHLDGDPHADADDGYAFLSEEKLHEHLLACAICRTALRRARRLDAALAHASGAELAHRRADATAFAALEQRWFAAVAQAAGAIADEACTPRSIAAEASPNGGARGASRAARVGAVAAVLLALAWVVPTAAAPTPVVAPVEAGIALPADAIVRLSRLRRRADLGQQARGDSLADLHARLNADGTPQQDRLASARQLLAAATSHGHHAAASFSAWLEATAARGDQTATEQGLHESLLDLLRASIPARQLLAERLHALAAPGPRPDRTALAAIAVAARVGDATLDGALRRLVRRRGELAAIVALALRAAPRAGAAGLLLDLWHEVAVRGATADDARVAAAWFPGQPASCFAELAEEARHARATERRRRALLALGWASDDAARDLLLAKLADGRVDEAMVAAFALGNLPWPSLRPLLTTEPDPLLRAALLRAGLPVPEAWRREFGSAAKSLAGASLPTFLAIVGARRGAGREGPALAD